MTWRLNKVRSVCGEEPGSPSKIGFRGTRFSVTKDNRLYVTDYNNERCYAKDEMVSQFCRDVHAVLGAGWTYSRIRIRANGDVYASGVNHTYVGNLTFSETEVFSGYLFMESSYKLNQGVPQIYAGPQTHGHVGERWSIPSNRFANNNGKLGNVGIKYKKGDWIWSKSSHKDFINHMKRRLHLGGDFIRFYITCYGLVVTPIGQNHWKGYGIDIEQQVINLNRVASNAAHSVRDRIGLSRSRDDENVHLLLVIGHIDDLMGGNIPEPDDSDPRTRGVDEK